VKVPHSHFFQVVPALRSVNEVSTRQVALRYASSASIGENLLAFTGYMGYPRALTAFFGQGFE
jgi:hypothetical protein